MNSAKNYNAGLGVTSDIERQIQAKQSEISAAQKQNAQSSMGKSLEAAKKANAGLGTIMGIQQSMGSSSSSSGSGGGSAENVSKVISSNSDLFSPIKLDGDSKNEKEISKRVDYLNNVAIGVQAEKYLKKLFGEGNYSSSQVEEIKKQLTWDQQKINYLWEKTYEKSVEIGIPIPPKYMLAILFTEGTGSFNTNSKVFAGDGGHGVQPDYEKDIESALSIVAAKIVGYPKFKEQFKNAAIEAEITADIFNYINFKTPMAGRRFAGVYAGSLGWGNLTRQIYGDLSNGEQAIQSYVKLTDGLTVQDVNMPEDKMEYDFFAVPNGVIARPKE